MIDWEKRGNPVATAANPAAIPIALLLFMVRSGYVFDNLGQVKLSRQ